VPNTFEVGVLNLLRVPALRLRPAKELQAAGFLPLAALACTVTGYGRGNNST